ncbi:hypothetical protein LZ554_005962 [Drepanopeziza brunnea f. sp. 'monogermtubi']|nr:hypothetical protein LZ554_005962 [Drepanopeziza brunnea f. sp. 'monogermtubi']
MGSLISGLAILFILNPSNYLAIAAPVDSLTEFQDISSIDLSQAHNLTSTKEPTELVILCNDKGVPWKKVSSDFMSVVADRLQRMPKDEYCYAPAGPGKCRQQSCIHGQALTLCNDNDYSIQVLCNTIGWQGRYLSYMCTKDKAGNFRGEWFYGQYFDSQKYNIIARSERCGEPEGWPGKSK